MVNVKVHTLEDELCRVKVEAGCTGRQLKEAIEEATCWKELVCTQCLALGVNAIRDDEVVDFQGEEDVMIMMTRRPAPNHKILRPYGEQAENQQKALALAMRHFASSPVVVELSMHGIVYGIGQEEVEAIYQARTKQMQKDMPEENDLDFEHRILNFEMFEVCLPWKYVAGVEIDDVLAVLALQSQQMIIGDGISHAAAVLLLKDCRLLAATACIDEATSLVQYESMITSATFYAETCEALFEALPKFVEAMRGPVVDSWLTPLEGGSWEPLSPWSVKLHAGDLKGWNIGWWPRTEDKFNPGREGLGLPLLQFIPAMPENFRKAFVELKDTRSAMYHSLHRVLEICCPAVLGKGKKGKGGKGKGKGYDMPDVPQAPFSEAMSLFHAELAKQKQLNPQVLKDKILEPYLSKLEASQPPESVEYDFQRLAIDYLKSFETDLVFGIGKTSGEV